MCLERHSHGLGKDRHAVFSAFAVAHNDLRILEIDIFDPQSDRLDQTEPAAIQ
jgi:hypothetical protein